MTMQQNRLVTVGGPEENVLDILKPREDECNLITKIDPEGRILRDYDAMIREIGMMYAEPLWVESDACVDVEPGVIVYRNECGTIQFQGLLHHIIEESGILDSEFRTETWKQYACSHYTWIMYGLARSESEVCMYVTYCNDSGRFVAKRTYLIASVATTRRIAEECLAKFRLNNDPGDKPVHDLEDTRRRILDKGE